MIWVDAQLSVLINENDDWPGATPVTYPLLSIVATWGFEDTQVPDDVLEITSVVSPTQIWLAPDNEMIGRGKISIFSEGSEIHPVVFEVKVNVAVPCWSATTWPLFEMSATEGEELDHMPPVPGE